MIKKIILHCLAFILLSLLSQIGGIVWLIALLITSRIKTKRPKTTFLMCFSLLYLLSSLIVVPVLAKHGDRVALGWSSASITPHNLTTVLLNRNYVSLRLKKELELVALEFQAKFPDSKLVYLDANFPFFEGFPLLPHLSHDDGRKIDLAFYYLHKNKATLESPSSLGYGYYEEPQYQKQANRIRACKKRNVLYDMARFLNFKSGQDFSLDHKRTKYLLTLLSNSSKTHKIFLEPHLKSTLRLKQDNIRFQGCHSVRHDDHIHYQIN